MGKKVSDMDIGKKWVSLHFLRLNKLRNTFCFSSGAVLKN